MSVKAASRGSRPAIREWVGAALGNDNCGGRILESVFFVADVEGQLWFFNYMGYKCIALYLDIRALRYCLDTNFRQLRRLVTNKGHDLRRFDRADDGFAANRDSNATCIRNEGC
jgi:hypothetical protein